MAAPTTNEQHEPFFMPGGGDFIPVAMTVHFNVVSPTETNGAPPQQQPFHFIMHVPRNWTMFSANQQHTDGAAFEAFLNQLFQNAAPAGPPPASKRAVDALPVTTVTTKHTDEQVECVVCQEAFAVAEQMMQLPCEHTFHPDCVKPWLTSHNTCPTCRWELETDYPEFEVQRKERMAKRQQTNSNSNTSNDSTTSMEGDNKTCQLSQCQLSQRRDCCNEDESLSKLTCGHQFHTECLQVWDRVSGNTLCPMCSHDRRYPAPNVADMPVYNV